MSPNLTRINILLDRAIVTEGNTSRVTASTIMQTAMLCGKKGHIVKVCRNKDNDRKSSLGLNQRSGCTHQITMPETVPKTTATESEIGWPQSSLSGFSNDRPLYAIPVEAKRL